MSSTLQPIEESFDQGLDLRLWRRLFGYARPYRRNLIAVAAFGAMTAAVDAAFPLVTKHVVDEIVAHGRDADLLPWALAYLGLTVALAVFVGTFIWHAGRIRTHVSHDIRRAGFANLQELSFSFYDRRPVGWLMARMTSDCERLSNIMAWGVLDFFWGTTLMIGVAFAMLVMNAKLALVVLAVVPALAWISAKFQKRILKTARVVRKTNSRLTATYNEAIQGVRTAKVFAREEHDLSDFRDLSGEMYAASVKNALLSALYLPVVIAVASVATGAALAAGGLEVTAGRISIGTLIAFLAYTRNFFDPIQEMAHWFAEMQMAHSSAERVLGLIDAVPDVRDADGVAPNGHPARIGRIEFTGVQFRYVDGPPVLHSLDLTVEPGETIALVGPTGGGKTTIVSLLCRFYEPTVGEVRFDGTDYRRRPLAWLQSKLGIVLQEPHLFGGSVAENIRYGRLDASDAEVEEAARLVGAHEFVMAMEGGYGAEVGERGDRLSTGQKQLVSFARAVLADPQILVMDEATSSVDTETERKIQAGLARVLAGRTSFVIAHRLSTIRGADRILVIEGGRIVEQGTHRELLALGGRYHALYTRQRIRESAREESWIGDAAPVG
ncbi:MAG: ABC transporter ATP-binding protein [Candidatus Eiseniibacteriota bacterium]